MAANTKYKQLLTIYCLFLQFEGRFPAGPASSRHALYPMRLTLPPEASKTGPIHSKRLFFHRGTHSYVYFFL